MFDSKSSNAIDVLIKNLENISSFKFHHIYIYTCMHAYIYINMYMQTFMHMYVCMNVYKHTSIHTYIYAYIHAYMHMHACMHLGMYACMDVCDKRKNTVVECAILRIKQIYTQLFKI